MWIILIILLIFALGALKIYPFHKWMLLRFKGIKMDFGEFLNLNKRCNKSPFSVVNPYLSAKKSGMDDLTLDLLIPIYQLNGNVRPFIFAVQNLRSSGCKLDINSIKDIYLMFGTEFRKIIHRSTKKEEIVLPSFKIATGNKYNLRVTLAMVFQLDIDLILNEGKYSSDDLLFRVVEKHARPIIRNVYDYDELKEKIDEVKEEIREKVQEKCGIVVHEIKFLSIKSLDEKTKRIGMDDDLYEQLEDDILLDQSMSLDDEINQKKRQRDRKFIK